MEKLSSNNRPFSLDATDIRPKTVKTKETIHYFSYTFPIKTEITDFMHKTGKTKGRIMDVLIVNCFHYNITFTLQNQII